VEVQEPKLGVTEVFGAACANPANPAQSGWTLHALDKDWLLPALEPRIKGQFEQWVRDGAKTGWRIVELTDPDEANAMRSVFASDFRRGDYNWDMPRVGRHVRMALASDTGAVHLTYLMLRRAHPDMTESLARDIVKDMPQDDFLLAYHWMLGVPPGTDLKNSKAPAATGAETTSGRQG
jgi:hypothetical protein